MTNKKQGNLDQKHTDNLVQRSGVRIYRKKIKKNLKEEHLINLKTCHDLFMMNVDPPMHVNKNPGQLVTVPLRPDGNLMLRKKASKT